VAAPRAAGPGEVTIDVHAAGLNFRDMMWALGLLPEEALIDGFAGPTFGLECAGIVRAVGEGVEDLAVGDRVAGFAPAALSTQVTTAAHAVTRIPDDTSFAAAATIPVTFITRFTRLARWLISRAGVLIHAGRRRWARGDPVRQASRSRRHRDRRIRGQACVPAPRRR
jgi:NADPH:quinone reductase-like Zn-dependent oxidoreductase